MDEETGLYYYGARYYNPRESIFLSTDPLAEMFPNISSYAYALLNPVKLIDPTGMAPESVDGVETKYKNKNTGEVVEVHDGKDVTVEVNEHDFAYAKLYESQLNGHANGKSYPAIYLDDSYDDIIDKYDTFYYETRYGNRLTRYQDSDYWLDSGPKFRRSAVIGGAGGLELIVGGAGKAGNLVKIEAIDNNVMLFSSKVGKEVVEGVTNYSVKEGALILDQLHLAGSKSGNVGREALWNMAKDLGKQFNVKEVLIQGGRRSTGKYKGKVPSPIKIKVE